MQDSLLLFGQPILDVVRYTMNAEFVRPVFDGRSLELRYENAEVCIYGTREGLKKLSDLIQSLALESKEGHIHLEDYEVLTEKSVIGTIAVFSGPAAK